MKKQKDLLTELRTAERNLVAEIPPGADATNDYWRRRVAALKLLVTEPRHVEYDLAQPIVVDGTYHFTRAGAIDALERRILRDQQVVNQLRLELRIER